MVSVLVVDDESGARTMLAMALRGADMRVETVADGNQALDMVKRRAFDWIVSDIRLPGIDGVSLAREIARIRPDTNIILISAVASDDDVQRLPIKAFWRKPFDPLALQQFIMNAQHPRDTKKAHLVR